MRECEGAVREWECEIGLYVRMCVCVRMCMRERERVMFYARVCVRVK